MPINLINHAWIPVLTKTGERKTIAPWQMADADLLRPDWPRPDLNLGCLEFLIGLIFLADPPEDSDDWEDRQDPDPERLSDRLRPFASAFELTGDGPRFLQDLEDLPGAPNTPDMLFIDSAGANTARNNADLMVHRGRYPVLDPALAAMALYTFQAHAPSGGAGNRTSMRGGGPMVTLIEPGQGLWPMIWANVPDGMPGDPEALPWMQPTQVSQDKGSERYPQQGIEAESFFGTPRRLRLVEDAGQITGVVQRPYGANYAGWVHPLTPYYRMKEGAELLPKHPKPGRFGYRNWLGVVVDGGEDALSQTGRSVALWHERSGWQQAHLIVAGWAMDNMKPLDFTWSEPPLLNLPDGGLALRGMIGAADLFCGSLRGALAPVMGAGEARQAVQEAFYDLTQAGFEQWAAELVAGRALQEVARDWVAELRRVSLRLFDDRAVPGLADRPMEAQHRIARARAGLVAAFVGAKGNGAKAYELLGLEPAGKPEVTA
ncbi:type I-E CRISPR-associated protein Cse1/CasA [Marinibacterium profundimaris]|uniref:type I-E CRISPR-associated protein Cse1/CasA n=1 Tax=Marinibacterium profundimaris TaxID=1679460 RepID=UPI000B52183F|nr:type I-E CRISPR-associated protein Cse1/CasA [Marinibacterium profundimaris]